MCSKRPKRHFFYPRSCSKGSNRELDKVQTCETPCKSCVRFVNGLISASFERSVFSLVEGHNLGSVHIRSREH